MLHPQPLCASTLVTLATLACGCQSSVEQPDWPYARMATGTQPAASMRTLTSDAAAREDAARAVSDSPVALDRAAPDAASAASQAAAESGSASDAAQETRALDAAWIAQNPHPEFAFAPSGVAARVRDFAQAVAAVLDCPAVHIDSSSETPIQQWCGTPPQTQVVSQTSGPEVLVIPLLGLRIDAQTKVTVTGERPVLFVVKGHVVIDGGLDASAHGETPGAGGDFMCAMSAGEDAEGREGHNGAGGGGGAFATRGGAGGDDRGVGSRAGAGGAPRGNAELVPLIAGCPGGHGGGCYGHPGGGGGALQISASGSLLVSGTLAADGGDGSPGCYLSAGGTGGGSGGALLLEAQMLDVSGAMLHARGGTGGAGDHGAAPGQGASSNLEPGSQGAVLDSGAGGGGGGYGRIRLRAETTCLGCP